MAALRPGTQVILQDLAPPIGAPTDTGVWFVCGLTEKGSVTKPVKLQNMSDYATYCGQRVTYGVLYDALDTYFREGGKTAYVSRVVGSAPVLATKSFSDAGALVSLRVDANDPGAWGNNLKVGILAGGAGGTFQIQVTDLAGTILDQSSDLATKTEAVAWGNSSTWVNVVDLGVGVNPAPIAAAALAGGNDDQASINDASWQAALDRCTSDLGPGQISMPGRTTTVAYGQQTAHAAARNRIAVMDAADIGVAATLSSTGIAQRADANARYGGIFAPWVVIPGLVVNTTRIVPPSAMVAGLMGRNDSSGSPNRPAAGNNGISRFALDVHYGFTDLERDTMNTNGINIIRNMFGDVKLYGYRTGVNPATLPNWMQLSNVRLYMTIVAKGQAIAENHVFHQIDGRGMEAAAFGGELKGMLVPYWEDGSLYGTTPAEAFSVDVSDAVNTPTTIANGELHALVSLRMSPFAELVVLQIVKVPVTQSLT
jgi:phage tail sheath protein FI